ncbi:S-layer protein [Levilactobacillus brevis]|uniref:S-layer protein n=1 Tax=Levilactobacillus brevis TaxID=1580 RepID=UPI0020731494|nr:S-layer protein [Levilactobacillus brevis]MCM6799412.1 S-layer protein [Levilactobacillus brevis]MCM6801889.1 S-layer protein [Levilactobacillus brevis]MCM6806583.1 S-layer protein [Levilactobacillus brevis]MCM6807454.1 S-layer protein [Levilactobacillus brevis]MCM6813338.1 S-layer protein [Levilactobacillus brevis]
MRSSFAKSIYFGAAVLGLVGLSAVTTTTASAKSAAKVTSSKALTTDANTRNVTFTGTNALYSKPGTVKGAKVVATTTTVKHLAASKNSQDNLRAYRVAKTNRGSIYYKVVSYNKVYRGWVYGGKSDTAFAGGLTSYDTFKEGTLTADQKTGTYKLANPGKTEAGLTYKQPAWTQYKIGKTIADTTAYKDATFSVDKVGTRTREGDTWVHVVNQNTADTKADGWILLSNLTQTNAFNEQSQVKVSIKDTDGKTLKEFNYTAPSAKGKDSDVTSDFYTTTKPTTFNSEFDKAVQAQVSGTGYTVAGTDTVNQSAKVLTGSTLNLVARKGDTVSMKVQPWAVSATPDKPGTHLTLKTTDTPAAGAHNLNTIVTAGATMTTPFSGVEGQTFTSTDLVNNLTANKLNTLTSVKYAKVVTGEGATAKTDYVTPDTANNVTGVVKDDKGNVQLFQTEYTLSGGVPGTFAKDGIAQALYTANEVKTTASATNPDAGNGSLFG